MAQAGAALQGAPDSAGSAATGTELQGLQQVWKRVQLLAADLVLRATIKSSLPSSQRMPPLMQCCFEALEGRRRDLERQEEELLPKQWPQKRNLSLGQKKSPSLVHVRLKRGRGKLIQTGKIQFLERYSQNHPDLHGLAF